MDQSAPTDFAFLMDHAVQASWWCGGGSDDGVLGVGFRVSGGVSCGLFPGVFRSMWQRKKPGFGHLAA